MWIAFLTFRRVSVCDAQRQFSVSCRTDEQCGDFVPRFLLRNVHGGEDIQIEAMDIPRCFHPFCDRNWEWIDRNAVFSGKGDGNLSRRA